MPQHILYPSPSLLLSGFCAEQGAIFFPGWRRKRVKRAREVGEKNALTAIKSHEFIRRAELICSDLEKHLTLQVLNVSHTRPDL